MREATTGRRPATGAVRLFENGWDVVAFGLFLAALYAGVRVGLFALGLAIAVLS